MSDIKEYIASSLAKGRTRGEITEALRSSGWGEEAIEQAFASVENPQYIVEREEGNAKAAQINYLYLLSFITLYVSVFSFLRASFGAIDSAFGSAAQVDVEGQRWAVSFLVVMFPVFLLTNYFIKRISSQSAGQIHMSATRRNFTYITLFLTALALIISAVFLVYELTGGGLFGATAFKLLATILTAGGLFGYYFSDAKNIRAKK